MRKRLIRIFMYGGLAIVIAWAAIFSYLKIYTKNRLKEPWVAELRTFPIKYPDSMINELLSLVSAREVA